MTQENQNDITPTSDPALASASGSVASQPENICFHCQQPITPDVWRQKMVRISANQEPVCDNCTKYYVVFSTVEPQNDPSSPTAADGNGGAERNDGKI